MTDRAAQRAQGGSDNYQTLTESLEELERTDPEVRKAKENYEMVRERILTKARMERGDEPTPHDDLTRIMGLLNIPLHARPVSPHEVVVAEVLPRIAEWREFIQYLAATTGPDGDKARSLLKEPSRRATWSPK
jgi:hypothetical protein